MRDGRDGRDLQWCRRVWGAAHEFGEWAVVHGRQPMHFPHLQRRRLLQHRMYQSVPDVRKRDVHGGQAHG